MELELLLKKFVEGHPLVSMPEKHLNDFEKLLQAEDRDVYDWILGRSAPPENGSFTGNAILQILREQCSIKMKTCQSQQSTNQS